MLLTLCSKNNEEDVIETFRAHPEMPLRSPISRRRASTGTTKGANLAALAEELDLGLDSFILVDDNPKEVHGSAGRRSGSAGAGAARAAPTRSRIFCGTSGPSTARASPRKTAAAGVVRAAGGARARRAGAASLEEFLASLQLEVAIAPMEPAQVDRVAQLTQRTNQMNATCVRRTRGGDSARLPRSA